MRLPTPHIYTIEEYLSREERAETKHEFHEGEILAMSGGTYPNSLVALNFLSELHARLKSSPCTALESNMRVRIASTPRYVYPDGCVVCGEPQFDPLDTKLTTILNPRLILEVLSESTEGYDRGEKFTHYQKITSLQEYVLVTPNQPLVETFFRQPDGTWSFAAWTGMEGILKLRSVGVDLPLKEIYARVPLRSPADAVPD